MFVWRDVLLLKGRLKVVIRQVWRYAQEAQI